MPARQHYTCTVDQCDNRHRALGLCGKHYQRMKLHGSLELPKRERPFPHGTINGYARFGCRCDECRAAERRNKARYRSRHKAKVAAATREYEQRNKDRTAARRAAERVADPEKFRKRFSEYAKANPDIRHLAKLRRRAREANAENLLVTVRDWRRLCDRYRHCCAYCGKQLPLTRDHVIPLSRGGRNAIGNLVPACGSCNYSKGDKLVVEWRQSVRRRAATT